MNFSYVICIAFYLTFTSSFPDFYYLFISSRIVSFFPYIPILIFLIESNPFSLIFLTSTYSYPLMIYPSLSLYLSPSIYLSLPLSVSLSLSLYPYLSLPPSLSASASLSPLCLSLSLSHSLSLSPSLSLSISLSLYLSH